MTQFSRRNFLSLTARGIGLAVISKGLIACSGSGDDKESAPRAFSHGVASGDPTQNAVILWTRVSPVAADFAGSFQVRWEVATDQNFTQMITNGETRVDASTDYTVKIDAVDLEPNTVYYYRFNSGDLTSEIGTTRTLPEGAVNKVSLAVMSCSNYPTGHFNVYDLAANINDIDVILHLGDYIYEYGRTETDGSVAYASDQAAALGREVLPAHELISLEDYRTRYAQYRTDESLQKLHANKPFIVVWDDHEVTNDTWKDGAENHQENEGSFEERKMAALQAYFEWLPIRPVVDDNREIINRRFQFGDLMDLYMLDTRVVGRDQQLNYQNYIDPTTQAIDVDGFIADVSDANRTLLGVEQREWLQAEMAQSSGTWQLLGQQVLMGRMLLPAAIATSQLSIPEFGELGALAQLAGRAQAQDPTLTAEELAFLDQNQDRLTPAVLQLLQLPSIPYNLDAWDGYEAEREMILATAKQLNKNLVVVAGDTHNAWANHLTDQQGDVVGVEFATSSVTSPGIESYLGLSEAEIPGVEQGIVGLVKDLQYLNANDRGFMTLTFTEQEVTSEWRYVDTLGSTDYQELTHRRHTVKSLVNNPNIQMVSAT